MARRTAEHPVFARRLAFVRERAGLSQTQLGLLAGMDPSVASPRINQYERGKHEPQLKTAKQLADALGVPPAFFYTEDELHSVVTRAAALLNLSLTDDGSREIARRARGTPRIAGRLLRRVRDFAATRAEPVDAAFADQF